MVLVVSLVVAVLMPIRLVSQAVPERSVVEVVRLGGINAPEPAAFTRPPMVALGADGRIVAREPTAPAVQVFASDGQHLQTLGGLGDGPGEFTGVASHGMRGDTVWMINFGAPRVSWFRMDGTHLRTDRLPYIDLGRPMAGPVTVTHFLADDRAVVIPEVPPRGVDAPVLLPVLVGDADMHDPDTLASVPRPTGLLIPDLGVFRYAPFPRSPVVIAEAQGRGLLLARWEEADPGTWELERRTPDGALAWSRSLPYEPRRISEDERAALIDAGVEIAAPYVARAREEGTIRGSTRELVEAALRIPQSYPPWRRLVSGADGTIWVERWTDEGRRSWEVLSAAGTPQFRVSLPGRAMLQAASASTIWATELGDLDVPYLVRFAIE